MGYIVVCELFSVATGDTRCTIRAQGLQQDELTSLTGVFTNSGIEIKDLIVDGDVTTNNYEVLNAQGVLLLNILNQYGLNYKVVSQSMVIEKTNIGGRTMQIQKIVWTMLRQ